MVSACKVGTLSEEAQDQTQSNAAFTLPPRVRTLVTKDINSMKKFVDDRVCYLHDHTIVQWSMYVPSVIPSFLIIMKLIRLVGHIYTYAMYVATLSRHV